MMVSWRGGGECFRLVTEIYEYNIHDSLVLSCLPVSMGTEDG
jgi:hypothetical protein